MASNTDVQNAASIWDYATNVPTYTLFNRDLPPYLSPKDFYDVGLGSMPDSALRSTPEERVRMAREIRRTALDALFSEMYAQDVETQEKCMRTAERRTEKINDAWVSATIEVILHEKEVVSTHTDSYITNELTRHIERDPLSPAEPKYADRATFHLAERFFTRLNGTVWLETASDADAEPTQDEVDAILEYRDSLARPAILQMTKMQDALFKSCGMAERGERLSHEAYKAAEELVKQFWKESEEARVN